MNEELKKNIEQHNRIVFFGGAGVSTESGIPDFRSQDGLYAQTYAYPPEEILSHSFFLSNPEEFFRFYRDKMIYPTAKPNEAHIALAKLEKEKKLTAVITQNIDGLHQQAGSKNVLELHGSVLRNYCMNCGEFYPLSYIINSTGIPKCAKCGGIVKPDVVLYEEGLDSNVLEKSVDAMQKASLLLIGGTSLNVYPAAGLIRYFSGKQIIVINKSATTADRNADLVLREPIGEALSFLL